MKTKLFYTLIVLLFLVVLPVSAQDGYTFKNDSLVSKVLGQNRKISIYLPEGYDKATGKFPVVYVLDATDRVQHTAPTARFLNLNGRMPKAIIVGIFNIDRNHDFLPDSSRSALTGGGAASFARFFREELIPYIDKGYKTEGYNVLVGHSYGGVFAMNCLINDPDLFNAYIAIDPSFWYKNRMMIKKTHDEFTVSKNWGKVLFISGREGNGMRDMGIDAMDSLLKASAPANLAWKVSAYADEDHGSVTFKSVYDGLRFIFDAGGNFDVYPSSGVIPRGASTFAFVVNNSPALHYTLDGTEPTAQSPLCHDTILINKPCTLKVKSMKGNYSKGSVITRIFSAGDYMQGLKTVKNIKPGLKYTYYEGVWDSVPDMNALKPIKKGINPDLDLGFAAKKDSFALRFEGYLHIVKQGVYFIWLSSDDGAKVYFDSQLLLNNDGLHDASRPVVKLVPLMPGYYPITIDYFEKTGDQAVTVGTVDDKIQPVPFTKDSFFHRE